MVPTSLRGIWKFARSFESSFGRPGIGILIVRINEGRLGNLPSYLEFLIAYPSGLHCDAIFFLVGALVLVVLI